MSNSHFYYGTYILKNNMKNIFQSFLRYNKLSRSEMYKSDIIFYNIDKYP